MLESKSIEDRVKILEKKVKNLQKIKRESKPREYKSKPITGIKYIEIDSDEIPWL